MIHHRKHVDPGTLQQWIAAGETRARIAARLSCSLKTVVNLSERFGLPIPPTLAQQRAATKPAFDPNKRMANAGFLKSVAVDPERDALTNGDVDEAAAERVRAARYAELRENHWELSRLVNVGEGDESDSLEKKLRRSPAYMSTLSTFNDSVTRHHPRAVE